MYKMYNMIKISTNAVGESFSPFRSSLVADLFKNLSAAQLKSGDFQGALLSADEALKVPIGGYKNNKTGEGHGEKS